MFLWDKWFVRQMLHNESFETHKRQSNIKAVTEQGYSGLLKSDVRQKDRLSQSSLPPERRAL